MSKRDVLIGLAAVGGLVAMMGDFIGPFIHRERSRAEIRGLHDALAPGMPREGVAKLLDGTSYPHLTTRRVSTDVWLAEAPYEFGAGNWIVVIEFQGERARAIRVRTADGMHIHPNEAPPDRVLPDSGSPDEKSFLDLGGNHVVRIRRSSSLRDCRPLTATPDDGTLIS